MLSNASKTIAPEEKMGKAKSQNNISEERN